MDLEFVVRSAKSRSRADHFDANRKNRNAAPARKFQRMSQ